jgi:myo-inositol-1(or 4)-monophosphatase
MELSLDRKALDELSEVVRSCGRMAKENQATIHRSYKSDGTVLTETDLAISGKILAVVSRLFPEANIISEETLTPYKEDAPCTFVLDPSTARCLLQGLPSWAVAFGHP